MSRSNSNLKNKKKTKKINKKRKENISKYNIIICCIVVSLLLSIIISMIFLNNRLIQIDTKIENMNKDITLENIAPHYVFLGDSITKQYNLSKYFKGYSVVNSGEDGNQTEHLLNDMEQRVYRYNPSTVFLMIGTNDVKDKKSTEYIFENIKQLIEEIQINLPKTQIIIQSILPSQENWGKYDDNKKRKKVNEMLSKEYKGTDIIYIDLYDMLEDKETKKLKDEYTQDGLHLNDKAYKLITKELKEYMSLKNK